MSDDPAAILYTEAGNPLAVDGGNRLTVGADALPLPAGAAEQSTLATRASEATLELARALIASIKNTDGIKKIADGVQLQAGTATVGSVKLLGSDGLHLANVDSSHRLSTTSALVVPVGFVDVSLAVQGLVAGNVASDTDHVIPDGKTLSLSQFYGGGEVQTGKQSKFELYHSTDGGATDGTLLAFGYIGGSNNFRVDLNHEITGSGVNEVLRMRRERMDGVSLELAAGWIGIETV